MSKPGDSWDENRAGAVFVFGMHRSGTSALAGGLYQIGVNFGENLMPATEDRENQKGYFEDVRVVRAHDQILGSLQRSWDDPRPLPEGWMVQEGVKRQGDVLRFLIEEKLSTSSFWGIKDPRICLMWPLWRDLLEEFQVRSLGVPIVRSPLEVAGSLQHRNGFSIDKGLFLWWKYMVAMARNTQGFALPVITYDRLLEDPVSVLLEVVQQGQLPKVPSTHEALQERLGGFVSSDLKHQKPDKAHTCDPDLLHKVQTAYDAVLEQGLSLELFQEGLPVSADLQLEHLNQVQERDALLNEKAIVSWAARESMRKEKEDLENRLEVCDMERKKLLHEVELLQGHLKNPDPNLDALRFEKDRAEEYAEYAKYLQESFDEKYRVVNDQEKQIVDLTHRAEDVESSTIWRATGWIRQALAFRSHFLGGLSVHRNPLIAQWARKLPAFMRENGYSPLMEGTLSLPSPAENPRVSIVVPVSNQMHLTLRCLESIANAHTSVSYEVIVVDDASSDATPFALRWIPHLRVRTLETHVGFVEACNQGAAMARGEMLLFLHNDTLMGHEFLEKLLRVFDQHIQVGLVGARLILPGEKLEECGAFLWSNGKRESYGYCDYAHRIEFQYVREVDVVSSACMIIPQQLFQKVDGFDRAFSRCLYEDADLAYRVRAEGYRVMVQPQCQVLHHSGGTTGWHREDTSYLRRNVMSRDRFVSKWQDALADAPREGQLTPEEAMRHRCGPSVLFVDYDVIDPRTSAGAYRTQQMLELLLEEGCHLTFSSLVFGFEPEATVALQELGVRVLFYPGSYSLKTHLEEEGAQYDLVILSRDIIAETFLPWVRAFCPKAHVVYDTVDLHYLREQRRAELMQDPELQISAERTRRRELNNIKESDITLVVSPVEKELLAEVAPDAEVRILPTIFDTDPTTAGFGDREGIVFIGSFLHEPNIDAVHWFGTEVMPHLRRKLPGIHVTVLGPEPPAQIQALAGEDFTVTGWVKDVRPYFEKTLISVAPLRFGAGVKGKINMSLSWGVPVVGTPVACEGMYLEDGVTALIAEDAEAFADAVVRGATDSGLWEGLRAKGLAEMEQRFSREAARPVLQHLLGLPGQSS